MYMCIIIYAFFQATSWVKKVSEERQLQENIASRVASSPMSTKSTELDLNHDAHGLSSTVSASIANRSSASSLTSHYNNTLSAVNSSSTLLSLRRFRWFKGGARSAIHNIHSVHSLSAFLHAHAAVSSKNNLSRQIDNSTSKSTDNNDERKSYDAACTHGRTSLRRPGDGSGDQSVECQRRNVLDNVTSCDSEIGIATSGHGLNSTCAAKDVFVSMSAVGHLSLNGEPILCADAKYLNDENTSSFNHSVLHRLYGKEGKERYLNSSSTVSDTSVRDIISAHSTSEIVPTRIKALLLGLLIVLPIVVTKLCMDFLHIFLPFSS